MKQPLARIVSAPVDALIAAPAHAYLSAIERVRVNRARRMPGYPDTSDAEGDSSTSDFAIEMSDFIVQYDMEMEALPTLPGEQFARRLTRRPAYSALLEVKFAFQRVTRGWDDRSLWSLDVHLARTLAEQLDALAAQSHGWPQSDEFPEFEDWQAALRQNAARLHAYQARLFDPTGDETDIPKVVAEGQAAMRWVADHLPNLWD